MASIRHRTVTRATFERESRVFLEAEADVRHASHDALLASADTFQSIALDPDADQFERFNAAERLRAFTAEIARRERVERVTSGQLTRFDRDREAWTRLAVLVKERAEVPQLLELAGVTVTRTGRSRRSGADEFHSGCPVCRDGVDRLVSWSGPHGRVWCRQCGWSTDAIGVASLIAGDDFRAIVRWLATYMSIGGAH